KTEKRSGRPKEIDDDEIANCTEQNPRYTAREVANILNMSQELVSLHLKKLVRVAHELMEKLKRYKDRPFLK
ncbi:Histone-lysine N-methyltransferase SETMAR, partial [Habropoda laboriosa]